MGFNPLEEKGIPLDEQTKSWSEVNVEPYKKTKIDPYTRCRVILMNGAEFEGQWFGHQFARHTGDIEIRRRLALSRRLEQQQQKMIGGLVPANESVIEQTIGYEQVAVDLTAYLARTEPNEMLKAALDFALLEDFDHLYRYANLMHMVEGKRAEQITSDYTEITVGRPTKLEHRYPFDDVRNHYQREKVDVITQLHAMTIVAAEQQTMNFYMNVANRLEETLGRGLYSEIAQIEEQHVTHYESLLDPDATWFERLVMHEYNECYLYWSCAQSETDERIKSIWEEHLEMEIGHLQAAVELMKAQEGKDPADMLPKELPEPVIFQSNVDYVRDILAEQARWNADGTKYVPMDELGDDHRFWMHQRKVNEGGAPSEDVIQMHRDRKGGEYRQELAGEHPIEEYRPKQ